MDANRDTQLATRRKREADQAPSSAGERPTKKQRETQPETAANKDTNQVILTKIAQDDNNLNPNRLEGKPHPIVENFNMGDTVSDIHFVERELQEARDSGILNPTSLLEIDDKSGAISRVGALVYGITHDISDVHIKAHMIPPEPGMVITNPGGRLIRDRLRKQKSTYQRAAGKFFLQVAKSIRAHYDIEEFDAASPTQRNGIWRYVFETAPLETTRAMLGPCAYVFDLENIFCSSNQDKRRRTWIRLFKQMFKMGCEYSVRCCPGDLDQISQAQYLDFYSKWQSIPLSAPWIGLSDLWTTYRVPVSIGFTTRGRTRL